MGTYQGLTEHVVMSRTPCTLRDDACATRIKPDGGRSENSSRKGVAEAMNDNERERGNP
jgi:hypothetical protein